MASTDQFDLSNFKPPNISGRKILWIFIGILVFLFVWQSWFTVNPEEVGIVLRFGKYTRQAPSGLNFKQIT